MQQGLAPPAPCAASPVHPAPPAFASASAVDPPPPGVGEESNATTVQRLQSAVARVLPAIETIIARLGGGNLSSDGLEKAGRALGALTRTLRELNGLLAQHNEQPGGPCPYCDGLPDGYDNIDDFRNDLARRINAFVESRRNPDGTFELSVGGANYAVPPAPMDGPART